MRRTIKTECIIRLLSVNLDADTTKIGIRLCVGLNGMTPEDRQKFIADMLETFLRDRIVANLKVEVEDFILLVYAIDLR